MFGPKVVHIYHHFDEPKVERVGVTFVDTGGNTVTINPYYMERAQSDGRLVLVWLTGNDHAASYVMETNHQADRIVEALRWSKPVGTP